MNCQEVNEGSSRKREKTKFPYGIKGNGSVLDEIRIKMSSKYQKLLEDEKNIIEEYLKSFEEYFVIKIPIEFSGSNSDRVSFISKTLKDKNLFPLKLIEIKPNSITYRVKKYE